MLTFSSIENDDDFVIVLVLEIVLKNLSLIISNTSIIKG